MQSEKKKARRYMAYVLPYLEVEDGKLTNNAFADGMRQAITLKTSCTSDPADWTSDGPRHMPDWDNPKQTAGGWVDAVYNNPTDPDTYLIGTRTSGIMRTENSGVEWECVTDDLDFPVLGTKRMVAAPDNPNTVLVVTGTVFINGGVIYSTDNGINWSEVEQELPQFHWMDFHPSIDGLVFATSDLNLHYSFDYGLTWS